MRRDANQQGGDDSYAKREQLGDDEQDDDGSGGIGDGLQAAHRRRRLRQASATARLAEQLQGGDDQDRVAGRMIYQRSVAGVGRAARKEQAAAFSDGL